LVEGDKLVRISSTYLQPEACLQLGKVQVLLAEIMQNILTKIRQDREAEK
jgi:hypothetical protein